MDSAIISQLRSFADPTRATHSQHYFKTGKGEYGEGDKFLGLTVPQTRSVAQKFWPEITLPQLLKLLHSAIHECRQVSLMILTLQYQHQQSQEKIYQLYLANTKYINNWDLIDSSAPRIVGDYLLNRPRKILYKLAKSDSLWERRISIIATFAFIAQGDLADAIKISTVLLHDPHDLIHKAVGWVLREVGKKDQTSLLKFLETHAPAMPRTMLRYAIEKLDPVTRRSYLNLR